MFRLNNIQKKSKSLAPKRGFSQVNSSDDESEPDDFASVMKAKAKRVSQLADKAKSDFVINESELMDNEPSLKKKTTSNLSMDQLKDAKRRRELDMKVQVQETMDLKLQAYLEKNKEAFVFDSEDYLKQKSKLEDEKKQAEERDRADNDGASFYSNLIQMRMGNTMSENNSKAIQTQTEPQLEISKLEQNPKNFNFNDKTNDVLPQLHSGKKSQISNKVLEYVRSKVSENDLLQAKKRYYQRKNIFTNEATV